MQTQSVFSVFFHETKTQIFRFVSVFRTCIEITEITKINTCFETNQKHFYNRTPTVTAWADSCRQTRPSASQSSCRQTRTGVAQSSCRQTRQVQHKALVDRHVHVQHKALVNRHVQVQHRLLQTESTDAAQTGVGHTTLGTALAAVEQIRAFEAQACSCRPDTSGDRTDCCRTDTQTRPGKAQTAEEETRSRAAQAAIEETHVQRQHRLL